MDEGFFLFLLFCGFLLLTSIIYCFLSTCLGIQIRRSDIWEAFSFPSASQIRERDRQRRARASTRGAEYELEDMDSGGVGYDRMSMGMGMGMGGGAEELEMMKRNGSRFY